MTQQSILLTGASSGIGYDAALGFRALGFRVFASCRAQAACDRLIAEGFASPRIDYTDSDSIVSGLAAVLDATGGTLDVLYNNGATPVPARSRICRVTHCAPSLKPMCSAIRN